MSHVVRMAVKITSLSAAKKAVARLGGVFYEGQKTHRFYGRGQGKCDHAFTFPGCEYEVGLLKLDSGPSVEEYSLAWDPFETALERAMGGWEGSAFKQAYGLEVAIEQMAAEGNVLMGEHVMADGVVELEFAGL